MEKILIVVEQLPKAYIKRAAHTTSKFQKKGGGLSYFQSLLFSYMSVYTLWHIPSVSTKFIYVVVELKAKTNSNKNIKDIFFT